MDLYPELSSLLGPEIVSKDPTALEENSRDKWFASRRPDVVVAPGNSDQVSRLLRFANERKIPVADGVAVVEPGVITGDFQREVRSRRLFYPPDPASFKHSSIGGNIATN